MIVKNGKIIGRGHTSKLGGPHAEINALHVAGAEAKDATVYVTLEPCAHWGHTGPCCEALTKAKVKRVVIGIRDPFPLVNGKGIEHLKKHGVDRHRTKKLIKYTSTAIFSHDDVKDPPNPANHHDQFFEEGAL